MAPGLDLSNKRPRRFGMTREENQWDSLHKISTPVKNDARAVTPDINAPPQDSSDEASIAAEEHVPSGDAGTVTGRSRSGSRSPGIATSGKESSSIVQDGQREPSMEPSSIPAAQFGSSGKSKSFNVSQGSQKREKGGIDEDENDMFGTFSQGKRPKTGYGGSSQRITQDNIHHGSKPDQYKKPMKQTRASEGANGKPGLRMLKGVEDAKARGNFGSVPWSESSIDRWTAAKLCEQERADFKKPPSADNTRRGSRSQAYSSQNSQGSSQSSQECQKPSFRVPKRTTPRKFKERPTYKEPPNLSNSANFPRATRSNNQARKPLTSADPNDLPIELDSPFEASGEPLDQAKEQFGLSNTIQDAAGLAKTKLGLSVNTYKPPPSSKTTSSFPSTSFDDTSSNSPLSSPPPETPDISPTQKNIEYVNNASLALTKDLSRRCPLCKEIVDQVFYDGYFNGNERRTIRQQAQFCADHKRHAAETTWEDQCFPKIDWQQLDDRLKNYHDAIDDIMQGRKFSFYRNAFEDLVKDRKDRRLRKNLMDGEESEGLTPGYYGSRGARIMYEDSPSSR